LLHRTSAEKPLLPDVFKKQITDTLLSECEFGWVSEAIVNGDKRPVCVYFAHAFGPFILMDGIFWLPWASKRNKIETAVQFLNSMRKHCVILITALKSDIPFYEHIAKHGVLRRVGTLYGVYKDEPCALFQTREIR
jgi:hypothetical protein